MLPLNSELDFPAFMENPGALNQVVVWFLQNTFSAVFSKQPLKYSSFLYSP